MPQLRGNEPILGILNMKIMTLQGKDPLVEVFADAPIKIAQKFVYSRGY
jgi:hypothetical protein